MQSAVEALSGRMVPPPYGWDCWSTDFAFRPGEARRYIFQQGVVLRIIRVRWEGKRVYVRASTQAFRRGWLADERRWDTITGTERYSDHPPLDSIPEEVFREFRAAKWHTLVECRDGLRFPHRGWTRCATR